MRARTDAINGAAFLMPWAFTGYPGIACSPAAATMAARVAALGPVPARVAADACLPIAPQVAARQIAEGFAAAPPELWFARRGEGAAAFIRGVAGAVDGLARTLAEAGAVLHGVLRATSTDGAALFAALRERSTPADPVEGLFRACEMHRERRGAQHVTAATAHGLDPCELLVLTAAVRGPGVHTVLGSWPQRRRDEAGARLRELGFVDLEGAATDAGRACREAIERTTDLADMTLVQHLGADAESIVEALTPIAAAVVRGAPT